MPDMLGNIFVGYAVVAWESGYRAKDREEIGEALCLGDGALDAICDFLREWEKEGDKHAAD